MERDAGLVSTVPVGYAEHAPPEDLASWVACFWTRRVAAGFDMPSTHRVLPDGCVDILVSFGTDGDGVGATNGGELTAAVGVGPMTKALVISGPGPRLYLGVRFKPGCAYAALGIPASALLDETVDFGVLAREARMELDALSSQASDDARLRAMIELVRRRMQRAAAVPRSVRAAVRRILGADGNLRIASLAADVGITRQQLARQFATHVGVSPKMLARVARTHAVLARADAARAAYPRNVDWSAIAYDLGYYDQPHFIDDFKALTGATPGEWTARD
ncbi:MAG TPA: AraC family transcriptional regulator [Gemmatimonadaceae bacterium]|jgi:AraC-like DNA-binding protein